MHCVYYLSKFRMFSSLAYMTTLLFFTFFYQLLRSRLKHTFRLYLAQPKLLQFSINIAFSTKKIFFGLSHSATLKHAPNLRFKAIKLSDDEEARSREIIIFNRIALEDYFNYDFIFTHDPQFCHSDRRIRGKHA